MALAIDGDRHLVCLAVASRERPPDGVGPYFSEGARRLWDVLDRRQLTHREIREKVIGNGEGYVDVTRWLWGDVKPSRWAATRLSVLFRIPFGSWSMPPREPFTRTRQRGRYRRRRDPRAA